MRNIIRMQDKITRIVDSDFDFTNDMPPENYILETTLLDWP